MHLLRRGAIAAALAATAALALTAGPASAASRRHGIFGGAAVFVQTDNLAGNSIVVYARGGNGTLAPVHTYATGGLGGQLSTSVVDHLASQGSLVYDSAHGLLYAVNAGSNTISVFAVLGTSLALRQVIPSGGSFPVSIAVSGDTVYVLNALGGGTLAGFRVVPGGLVPIPGSGRALGLGTTPSSVFTETPGQVAFSPDGTQLIVTTKANGDDVDVWGVNPFGLLSQAPVVNSEPNTVPFALTFTPAGWLALAEAGPNAVALFALGRDGTIQQLASVDTGEGATCWITGDGNTLFASDAGGPAVSTVQWSSWGPLTLAFNTTTGMGAVDSTLSPDGRFLYVQTGGTGTIDEFAVGAGGALNPIGSQTVPAGAAVGGEGIAAS